MHGNSKYATTEENEYSAEKLPGQLLAKDSDLEIIKSLVKREFKENKNLTLENPYRHKGAYGVFIPRGLTDRPKSPRQISKSL